jgi:hypothetical protein
MITLVTGIFDLNRDAAGEGFKRPFFHYILKLKELLSSTREYNVVVYIEDKYKKEIESLNLTNIIIRVKEIDEFKTKFDFYEKVQKIRKDKKWLNQVGWLKDSTQATMELYNPMVMSKMFMLHDEKLRNHFNSDYFYWIDGGLTNTVHPGYFGHDKVIEKLPKISDKFIFVTFPYTEGPEIHGFDREEMNKLAGVKNVEYVCRGGFFGGHKNSISEINNIYYHTLSSTLNMDLMGTEESVFTLMTYQRPELFDKFSINGDGLVWKFFEDLKTETIVPTFSGVNLYVLTYNSPKQFEELCKSYNKQNGFLKQTKNYLIDNSSDLSTTEEYLRLCKEYNFEHIKKDNIGICGGRQFVAEHFQSTDSKYYIFLEDDMNLCDETYSVCRNGFLRNVPGLFSKILKIMDKENYDFLKFSYTEFFGDNGTQWSWYNVPQSVREKYWPEYPNRGNLNIDPNAPRTKFRNIRTIDGLSYIDGEIYYCNWPQIVSRDGNRKMFLDTKWGHPFEQTWMSHIYQLTKENKIKPALLLCSPINHHRFQHYDGKTRREN